MTTIPPDVRLAVASDPRFAEHIPPGFHPERPERLAAARRGLDAVAARLVALPARTATLDELARVHEPRYLETLERSLGAGGAGYLDADTFYSPGSAQAARLAAGGACAVVDALLDGAAEVGVLLARPPGHHATPGRAMGFCLLNNVAVAAAHARARGLARVAVVDWDVHHGNGTQAAFEADPSVLFLSLHQWPLYPGTGAADEVGRGEGRGATVNIPLPAGSDGGTYAAAFDRVVLPVLEAARPELVLVSAGFDAHARDPLAGMMLDAPAYAWMAAKLRALARTLGHGRVALCLEGGYDLPALEQSVAAAVGGLVAPDAVAPVAPRANDEGGDAAIARAIASQRAYWPAGVL